MMNNLKEKLEISKWLYEKGFEPDMWWRAGALVPKHMSNESSKPYFTLNRVLELLPERLPNDDDQSLFITKTRAAYITANQHLFLWVENKDTELAALRLLKQVVEAGYLKGENDE